MHLFLVNNSHKICVHVRRSRRSNDGVALLCRFVLPVRGFFKGYTPRQLYLNVGLLWVTVHQRHLLPLLHVGVHGAEVLPVGSGCVQCGLASEQHVDMGGGGTVDGGR